MDYLWSPWRFRYVSEGVKSEGCVFCEMHRQDAARDQKIEAALKASYNAEGYNLGINLGKCAGAGVADHLHLHILPRWTGDSSFISVIGETRVLPEDLLTTYDKLGSAFHSVLDPRCRS